MKKNKQYPYFFFVTEFLREAIKLNADVKSLIGKQWNSYMLCSSGPEILENELTHISLERKYDLHMILSKLLFYAYQ